MHGAPVTEFSQVKGLVVTTSQPEGQRALTCVQVTGSPSPGIFSTSQLESVHVQHIPRDSTGTQPTEFEELFLMAP